MNFDPSNKLRYPVPIMIVGMSMVGLLVISEGNKHHSTLLMALGCMAIAGAACFAFQWLQIKAKAWRTPKRKKK